MRRFTLIVVLILLIVGCYQVIFGNAEAIRSKVASVSQLSTASKKLNTELAELEKSTTDEFEQKKQKLSKTIEDYQKSKDNYE